MSKLFKYALNCADHGGTVYTDYIPEEDGEPTKCPLNEAHTSLSDIAIVDTKDLSTQLVKEDDTDKLDHGAANSVEEGFIVDIAPGVNPTQLSISFDYPVDLLSGKYYVGHAEHDHLDSISVFAIPPQDAAIGTVAQAAAIDATDVYVDADALQSLKPGFFTKFQGSAKEYRIKNIDYGTGKLTLDSGLDAAAAVGDTVHLRVPFVINQLVLKNMLEHIGDASAGSSNLGAGWTLRVDYNHENDPTVATKLGFALSYKY